MADVDYPATLRKAIQASKRRGQNAGYRESDPQAGPPFFERFSDDVPTTWRFQLRFTRQEAQYFWSWLKSPSHGNNGRAWFNMPIATEFGLQEQEVHFTVGGFPTLDSEINDVLTYQCEVIARDIQGSPDPDLVVSFNELYGGNVGQLKALDVMINRSWPEA